MMDARVFKQLLVDSVWPDLSDQALDLLVDFLQGIGEVSKFIFFFCPLTCNGNLDFSL